ncbi:MAG: hypothetical protein V2A73_07555 [Pseudomonadota bacterium]
MKNGLAMRCAWYASLLAVAACHRSDIGEEPVVGGHGYGRSAVANSGDFAEVAAVSYPLGSLDWHLNDVVVLPIVKKVSMFAQSLDIDGSTLIVGSTEWGPEYGQEYFGADVFVWNGTDWVHKDGLLAEIEATYVANYAWAVAVGGNIAAVGAPNEVDAAGRATGAVFIFLRNEQGTWSFKEKLIPENAGVDWFGSAVDLDGDTLLVGAQFAKNEAGLNAGAAYFYTWNQSLNQSSGGFEEGQRVIAGDGGKMHLFGISVSLDGDTAAIGARYATADTAEPVNGAGAVYVFRNDGASWQKERKLWASDPATNASFGQSVALDGDTLIAGADSIADAGTGANGAAYVFVRTEAQGWQQEQKLVAATGFKGSSFGQSVAIKENLIAIGAPWYGGTDNTQEGAAYIFARSEGVWTQITEFQAPGTAKEDEFGAAIALEESMAIVGAPNFDYNGVENSGAAFSFTFIREKGTPCDDAEQCSTGYCVDGVCCDSECGAGDTTDCQACRAGLGAVEDGTCTLTTVVCRPSRDGAPCDAPEVCDGKSVACPEDVLAGSTFECRPASNSCDLPELCTLGTDQCPGDTQAEDGATCEDASPCFEGGKCQDGVCEGGSYVLSFTPAGLTIYTVQGPKTAIQTVENKGTVQDIVVTGASASPADTFAVVSPAEWPLTIAPGKSAELQIRFVAAAAGTKTGSLYLDLAGCAQKMLPLVGIAEKDPAAVDAASPDSELGPADAQPPQVDGGNTDGGGAGDIDAFPDDGAGGGLGVDAGTDANVDDRDSESPQPDSPGKTVESTDSGCNCSVGHSTSAAMGELFSFALVPWLAFLGVLGIRRRRGN